MMFPLKQHFQQIPVFSMDKTVNPASAKRPERSAPVVAEPGIPNDDPIQSLQEVIYSSGIECIRDLVDAINEETQSRKKALLSWGEQYFEYFLNANIETRTEPEVNEYFCFVQVKADDSEKREFLRKWFNSVVNIVGRRLQGDKYLVQAIEQNLDLLDHKLFEGDPALLITLCNHLIKRVDVQNATFTRSTYPTHSSELYAIRQVLVLMIKVAPSERNPLHKKGLYQTYQTKLEDIRTATDYYPFEFLTELLLENLKHLQLAGLDVKLSDMKRRIRDGVIGTVCFAMVVRNAVTLGIGIDVTMLEETCQNWHDAITSRCNKKIKAVVRPVPGTEPVFSSVPGAFIEVQRFFRKAKKHKPARLEGETRKPVVFRNRVPTWSVDIEQRQQESPI